MKLSVESLRALVTSSIEDNPLLKFYLGYVSFEDSTYLPVTDFETPDFESGNEAKAHANWIRSRAQERFPPTYPFIPPGVRAVDRQNDVHVLENLQIDSLTLREADKNQSLIAKYAAWRTVFNSPFPPIQVVERLIDAPPQLVVIDGHHRVLASRLLGNSSINAWVSKTNPLNPYLGLTIVDDVVARYLSDVSGNIQSNLVKVVHSLFIVNA